MFCLSASNHSKMQGTGGRATFSHTWWRHRMEKFSALLAFCAGIHRSPANSPHKGQWRGALMLSLICAWINDWVNNREAGDLRRHCPHYDAIVMMRATNCTLAISYYYKQLLSRQDVLWTPSILAYDILIKAFSANKMLPKELIKCLIIVS